ncbi:hypothetical protein ALC56_02634, partial [Trachymyrmex septentrionalis]
VAIHGDPLHLHCRIILAASETKDRRETKVQGEENREGKKKVSMSTDGRRFTRHSSIYHSFEAVPYRLSVEYRGRSCEITSGSKERPIWLRSLCSFANSSNHTSM